MKKYKALVILGIVLLVITLVLAVFHFMMLAIIIGKTPAEVHDLELKPGLIGYFCSHLTVYGLAVVLPTFLLIAPGLFCVIFGSIMLKRQERNATKE